MEGRANGSLRGSVHRSFNYIVINKNSMIAGRNITSCVWRGKAERLSLQRLRTDQCDDTDDGAKRLPMSLTTILAWPLLPLAIAIPLNEKCRVHRVGVVPFWREEEWNIQRTFWREEEWNTKDREGSADQYAHYPHKP